ncbi:hypothetical protein [Xylanibacter brevis]|uniref:hypothetical protein n=1 Tax=Xylanibacter brevis TaxID=83231 RepID=UPI00047FE75A|nr:hypothetical protein [Xylanibacter brevis]
MTLALLLTAVTGAWAQSYEAKVFDVPASWTGDETNLSAADLPKDFVQITKDEAKALAVPDGIVVLIYGFDGDNVKKIQFEGGTFIDDDYDDGSPEARRMFIVFQTNFNAKICYTAPGGPKVAWDAATKTGTFAMPGSDVVLTPIYAKAAAFATTGTEPEVKTLLPEAAEGVIAGTDASLIAEGTGIVAFAGTSTDVTQGTLMYAIGTSATEAPALTAFSATVPTAKNYDDAATVNVWYYIQGADAPDGQQATEENTFNDTEPACLTVTVLTNKFDIQFNAANANTIEAGKATVTVGGTDKTGDITEGKLQGVKMGSEVKVKANTGYKFRKVEVKKGSAGPKYADVVTICEKNGDDKYLISSFFDGTNANITTITKEEAIALAEYLGGGDIRVVYEEFGFSGDRYASATNAAGDEIGIPLSTTNTSKNPLYYVPAGN